jgi:ribosomal protein S17E
MDEIQKVLIKAGRKDLAQRYYKKVADFDPQKNKQNVEELIQQYGGKKLSDEFLDAIGESLNVGAFGDEVLDKFFYDNHAFWSTNVGAFNRNGKVYLINYENEIVQIKMIGKKRKF